MSGSTIVTREDGPLATQVLAQQLSTGFLTPEVEDFHARQHELRTGQVLRRSWEVPTPEHPEREDEFQERAAAFREAYGPRKEIKLAMSPVFARRELTNMERSWRNRKRGLDASGTPLSKMPKPERERVAEDFRHMNALRALLGMPAVDYANWQEEDIGAELDVAYLEFSQLPDVGSRVAAVSQMTNARLCMLVYQHDPDDNVKRAAEHRFAQINVSGGHS